MRISLLSIAVVAALVGLFCLVGVGVIHPDAVLHAIVHQVHLLAGGGPYEPVCPGAGSTSCG